MQQGVALITMDEAILVTWLHDAIGLEEWNDMKFLSPDSPFMRGLSTFADAVWINILMVLTSIPIVTIGASLTAAHDAARRSLAAQGHVTSNFFKAFASNFRKSTLTWLIFGPLAVGLVYAWVILQITPLLIPKFAFSILWLIAFEWVWALQARFENAWLSTIANAFIFGISHIGYTLAMLIIDGVFLGLIVASWLYMPQGVLLLLIMGYGSVIMLHIPLLERVFRAYTQPEEVTSSVAK